MSIEAILEKNTAQLGEVLAALQANTAMLEKLHEGREAALEQLTAKDAEPAKPAKRKPAAKKEEEKKKEEPEADTGWNPDLSPDGLRAAFVPYLTGPEAKDAAVKAERVGNVGAILAELGVQSINPAEGKTHLEEEIDKRKAVFFVTRFNAGLPVDFKADYDFDADPLTQDASSDDDLVG